VERQPFPKPGARLVDVPRPRERVEGERAASISIFGGVGYSPGHPSRWAGVGSGGTSRLTVENESVVIRPFPFWRQVFRLPVVEIPLASIEGLNRIMFGVRFEVPGDPALDGTRFGAWAMDVVSLEPLIELLQRRGVVVETLPRSERSKRALRNLAVAIRPGLIWRDRGRLAFLESAVLLALLLGLAYPEGSYTTGPSVANVVVGTALLVCASVAGYRYRSRLRR
jgi:hypothetical protein